ncbi:MAG: tetratricopeptide repeat protein [Chloroflexota bacterium]
MNNIFRILFSLSVLAGLAGCQAGRVAPGKARASKIQKNVYGAPERALGDTAVVRLPDIKSESAGKPPNEAEREFAAAVATFDSGDYDAACPKFRIYSETLADEDSLRQEAIFMLGECDIARGKAASAMSIFESLFAERSLIGAVREKLLVRIGQLHCYMGNPSRAASFFDKLKTEYPRSIYIQVANCDSIK